MCLLLDPYGLVRREKNFFTLDCISLGGLSDELGFEFSNEGLLYKISFYHAFKLAPKESFETFQEHLEKTYGQPSEKRVGDLKSGGFPSFKWEFGNIWVQHFVSDRSKFAGRRTGFREYINIVNFDASHQRRELPFSKDTPIDVVLRNDGWLTCPRCNISFTIRCRGSWTGHSHQSCGQEIRIKS
jgi:hypothetical protein